MQTSSLIIGPFNNIKNNNYNNTTTTTNNNKNKKTNRREKLKKCMFHCMCFYVNCSVWLWVYSFEPVVLVLSNTA